MNNSDMPAMPSGVEQTQHLRGERPLFAGLTKREHFAGLAMQGMLSSKYVGDFGNEINDDSYDHTHGLANNAIRYADALLKELDK
jgi:hypothetical protein